jgi:hypothetical protein
MSAEWFYVENDTAVGPTSLADLAARFRRSSEGPRFVWTKGMSDWADATTTPEISSLFRSVSARSLIASQVPQSENVGPQKVTLAQRARHELIEYFAISAYLFICFSSMLFYKSAILRGEGIEFTVLGLALLKALILGKFILILQAVKVGERGDQSGILIFAILKSSVLFLIFLVALNAVEELGVGLFHGRAAREVLGEMAGGTLTEALAVCVLLLLVLIPYFLLRGLASRLGEGVLWKHLTQRGYAGTGRS